MGFLKSVKDWFKKETTFQEQVGNVVVDKEPEQVQENVEEQVNGAPVDLPQVELSKFDSGYYNPPLVCFGCHEEIKEGKIRFFNPGGELGEKPFHKKCFKKMQRGSF